MRSTRRLLLVAASSLALTAVALPALAQTAPSAPWPQASSDIPADANVRFGQLPNGMRYALLHNATPPGQASFRLRIAAGGLMEQDDQKGLAHFTEHMVFNGTDDIPETELLRILERLGLAFGADTNATTSLEQTFYMLELPRTDDETVDASLHIMREMMSDALMETAAIDNERGVIVGEKRTRDTPGLRSAVAQLSLLAEGQLLARRLPDGDTTIVETAPAQRFVDFYRNYYRPELATFIAVGDFDLDQMETKVRAAFESWQGVGPAGGEPDLGQVAARRPETKILLEPGIQSSIQLNWVKNPDLDADTAAERGDDTLKALGLAVLNRRLGEIARGDNPPFLGAGGSMSDIFDSVGVGTIAAAFNPGGWKRALETMEQEQRRLIQFGVTEAELQREITDTRTALTNAVAAAATRSTPALANGLVGATNARRVFSSPATNLALFETAVRGVTADQVNTAVRQVFEGQGPVMLVVTPVEIEGGEAAVTAALEASRQVPVTARADEAAMQWPYADFGTPGVPSSRTEVADLGVTLITFPNGVRLTVKPTDFRDKQILVSVRTGIGDLSQPKDRVTASNMVDNVLTEGGLGDLTVDQLNRVLSGRTYSVNGGMGTDSFQFSGGTKPEDLQLQMQVMAAYMTDPGLRAAPFEQAKSAWPQQIAQLMATPGGAFALQAPVLLAGGDQRAAAPTPEQVAAFTLDEVRNIVKTGLASGPIDIVMVGDVTVDDAIRTVASTFGALPARGPAQTPPAGADQRRFPAPTAAPVRLTHNGQAEQALGYIAWPTVDSIGDRTEARQIGVLSAVLQLRLNDVIREQLAIAYSPRASNSSSDVFPGYGSISAGAEVKPEDLPRYYENIEKIAADLRDNPISEDELTRARRPMVESLSRSRNDNGYWIGQLQDAQEKPASLDEIRHHVADLESVTPADIQRMAQTYLRPDHAWRAEVVSANAPAQ